MKKKLIIFDMDGTIYLGKDLLPGAKDVFNYLKDKGIQYIFFTNNSSHNLDFYYQKMQGFDIPCSLQENFYSSSELTIDYLLKENIKDIFVIGNKSFKDKLAKHFNIIKTYQEDKKISAVVVAFSTELIYQELRDGCLYLQNNDIPFIATNGDYRCPIENGNYIPDCGGMCEWMYLTTGKKATVMGKPNPVVVDYFLKKYQLKKEEIILVGDRLYTDILLGVNAQVDTICVLTGESSLKDIHNSEYKPTYVLPSIKDLIKLLEQIDKGDE